MPQIRPLQTLPAGRASAVHGAMMCAVRYLALLRRASVGGASFGESEAVQEEAETSPEGLEAGTRPLGMVCRSAFAGEPRMG